MVRHPEAIARVHVAALWVALLERLADAPDRKIACAVCQSEPRG
ncbi:hypothetical protein BCEP27_30637 [Burkholderia cepacia]